MSKDLCKRCGECCRTKKSFGLLWIALDEHCPNYTLDNGKGTCRIYGKHTHSRFGPNGFCMSVEEMIEARLAPNHCAYVKDIPNYISLVINYEEDICQQPKPKKEA
jgi:uncharacterized cysteine cluster protein YcgN (CxxCxxCC family)